jgi:hypothetical protein
MGVLARPSTQLKINDRAEFWARRRRWWAAEARRCGCDWPGVAKTILDVDQYLNGAAVVCNDYDTLSGTFSSACREADAARRNPRPRTRGDSLPTSTCDGVDWLLKYYDEQRLEKFIEGRPAAEIARIHDYIRIKLDGSHS